MPLNTLLNYLIKTRRTLNIHTKEGVFLNNVMLDGYIYSNEVPELLSLEAGGIWEKYDKNRGKYLGFGTNEGHQVWVDVTDVKEISFDAIVTKPTSNQEMKECIRYLENECEPYNVYLVNSKNQFILDLFRIKKPKI